MSAFDGKTAVVTGGTDGIGAATAVVLASRGARVLVIGRSQAKADALLARAEGLPGGGSLESLIADFSEMATVRRTVATIAEQRMSRIDLLVHAVGILISRTEHTSEGIEKDFAVGYLSRFVFLESARQAGLLHPKTRMVNVSASARKVPKMMQMDFSDLEVVAARVGMRSHGQAQLANELLTVQAAQRYGITAVGYGPGAVDTNIRREVPAIVRAVITPFFARSSRKPADVGRDLADILADPSLPADHASFYDRTGSFPANDVIADPHRQSDLLRVSLALEQRALAAPRG